MTPDRLGPPPVEPLSDLDWMRIERILWAKIDTGASRSVSRASRYRPWLWIGPPVVAAAAAAAIVVTQPEGTRKPAPHRFGVAPVRYVSGDSASSLSFGNAYVSLEPQTAVLVSGRRTLVERGEATFALAPSSMASAFEVEAGEATVSTPRDIETKFHVGRSAANTTVAVERGMIELTHRGEKTRLQAGQTWTSNADSTRDRYERLAALEVRDPAAALAGYLELAKTDSRWAEVSLFAAARLAGDRMDPRAGELLKSYLKRFPRGANAPDARAILSRLPVM
ncbi:MAG: hypothetical protein HOV81_37640 [Kofleriaceae bacterium]|nr:hypothetical protein [Kofleriaceae bacterium]